MNCPFCAEEIKDQAVVCIHCGRDLSIPRPLIERLNQMAERVAALEGEVMRLASTSSQAAEPARPRRRPAAAGLSSDAWFATATVVIATCAALLVAHYLLIMVYDVHLAYLRLTSIVVPMLAGGAYHALPRSSLPRALVAGLLIAVVSILGMSGVVAWVDHVPLLPDNAYDWRETFEYGASIFLGFLSGVLIARWAEHRHSPAPTSGFIHKVSLGIAETAHLSKSDELTIEKLLKSVESIVGSLIAISAAAGSLITGLSHVLN